MIWLTPETFAYIFQVFCLWFFGFFYTVFQFNNSVMLMKDLADLIQQKQESKRYLKNILTANILSLCKTLISSIMCIR